MIADAGGWGRVPVGGGGWRWAWSSALSTGGVLLVCSLRDGMAWDGMGWTGLDWTGLAGVVLLVLSQSRTWLSLRFEGRILVRIKNRGKCGMSEEGVNGFRVRNFAGI